MNTHPESMQFIVSLAGFNEYPENITLMSTLIAF